MSGLSSNLFCGDQLNELIIEFSRLPRPYELMNSSNDIPGPEALNALGWENLVTRRAKTKAKTMYKVLNKLSPSPLEKLFEHKRNITQYNLRGSSTSLQLPQPKTEKLQKSFSYDGANVWNSLSADVRGSAIFTIFKPRLCTHK